MMGSQGGGSSGGLESLSALLTIAADPQATVKWLGQVKQTKEEAEKFAAEAKRINTETAAYHAEINKKHDEISKAVALVDAKEAELAGREKKLVDERNRHADAVSAHQRIVESFNDRMRVAEGTLRQAQEDLESRKKALEVHEQNRKAELAAYENATHAACNTRTSEANDLMTKATGLFDEANARLAKVTEAEKHNEARAKELKKYIESFI